MNSVINLNILFVYIAVLHLSLNYSNNSPLVAIQMGEKLSEPNEMDNKIKTPHSHFIYLRL